MGNMISLQLDLPHINANFILHYENGRYEPRFLKEQPLHIELLITYNQSKNSLHGIRVTDDNGVQYLFGTTNRSKIPVP
ncbi:MAG: hypothetical protein V8R52_09415 [Coprobacter fastidiosus]